MGIKNGNNKKEAAALVLILIVLTSLAIMIVSTMKILIASDSRFSHNRNARGGSGTVTTGKFFCYKKWENGVYKLYQKRVDYAADGSISDIQDDDTSVSECKFQIPQGVKNYDILIVAGGGAGGNSSYSMNYDTIGCGQLSLQSHSDKECEIARKNVLENVFIELKCYMNFKPENAACMPVTICEKPLLEFDENSYKQKLEEVQTSSSRYYLHYDESEQEYICNNDSQGAYSNKKPDISYDLKVKYGVDGYSKIISGLENYQDIVKALETLLKQTNYSVKKPVYNIYSGQPGGTGDVTAVGLKGNIYGKDGQDFIIIKPEDIANAGREGDGKDTTFSYWHKNSSEDTYTEVKHFSGGGMAGVEPSSPSIVFKSESEVETVKGYEGIMPDYLQIPSVFKFSNLYAGFIKNSGDPVDATFFGASGASGRIDGISGENLTNCAYVEYKPDNNHTLEFNFNKNHYDTFKAKCKTGKIAQQKGSNGAPGAILISW